MSGSERRINLHPDFDHMNWHDALLQLYTTDAVGSVLHSGRNIVSRQQLQGRTVVVKHFRNRGLRKKIAYKIRSSKARRSFEHALQIMKAGLLSPQPIAWREDWQGGWLQQSFYVCDFVDAAYTVWDLKKDAVPGNKGCIAQLGALIGKLHNAGLHHQDLTPGNVLLCQVEQGFDMYVIDCNRMLVGDVSQQTGLHALVRMGLEGAHIDPYVAAYAAERELNEDWCQERYRQLLNRHQWKWRIKNKSRPWRRKLGL